MAVHNLTPNPYFNMEKQTPCPPRVRLHSERATSQSTTVLSLCSLAASCWYASSLRGKLGTPSSRGHTRDRSCGSARRAPGQQ